MFELAVVAAIILAIIALVRSQDASAELTALRRRLDDLERLQRERTTLPQSDRPLARIAAAQSPKPETAPRKEPSDEAIPETPSGESGRPVGPELAASPPQEIAEAARSEAVDAGGEAREKVAVRPLAPLPASMRKTGPAHERRGEDDDPLPVVGRPAGRTDGGASWGRAEEGAEAAGAGSGFEARFGSTWLLRIGLVFLVIAAALFGIVVTPRIGPAGKVGLGYVFSGLVFGAGLVSHRIRLFARPVMAGGLSLAFLVSYSTYFVEPMRCAPAPVSLALMSLFILAILFFADQWRSEFTGGLAVFLGHVGAFVAARNLETPAPSSLVAILFLSLAAVALLIRRSWIVLSLFAVVAAYGSHLLWTTLAGEAASPQDALYVNLAFLSSYYFIFTLSDVLWWWRNSRPPARAEGEEAEPAAADEMPALAMALGPLNLAIYTALASLVFITTKVQFENIHLFFFAMALVQGGLAVFHRGVGNRLFTFYPAAGTVLLTLGFFSAFEDLALNLVLAAEAMVLLVVAHQTRLRFFHLLSQAALLANFFHYLLYAHSMEPTRASFIGGMLTAAAYLVKSSLEEVWYGPGTSFAWKRFEPRSSIVRELNDAFDRAYGLMTPILAHLHAFGGALILIDQCRRFLPPVDAGLVLAAGTLAFAALGAWRGSVPTLIVSTVLYLGSLSLDSLSPGDGSVAPLPMAMIYGSGSFAAAVAFGLVALRSRPDGFRYGLCLWPAANLGLFLLAFIRVANESAGASPPSFIWFIAMIAGLIAVERYAALWKMNLRASRQTRGLFTTAEVLAGAVLAGHLFWLFRWKFEGAPLQFVLVSGMACILPLIGLLRRTAGVYASGLVLMSLLFLRLADSSSDRETLFASIPAALAVTLPLIGVAWTQDLLVRLFDELLTTLRRQLAFVLIALPYGYGLVLLFALSEFRIEPPWHFTAWVALCGALMALTQPFRLSRGARVSLFFFAGSAFVFVAAHAGKHPPGWAYLGASLSILIAGFAMERLWTLGDSVMGRRPMNSRGSSAIDLDSAGRLVLLLAVSGVALSSGWNSGLIGPRWTTAAWAVYAALVMIMGFAYRRASFRRIALGILALCTARVLLVDIRNLETIYQASALLVLGLCLVAIGWLYTRFSEQLRRWL